VIEVIVYLKEDYSINESIFVSDKLSIEEITELVNQKFETWYYLDIDKT
jgi:hypothetical protein